MGQKSAGTVGFLCGPFVKIAERRPLLETTARTAVL